MKVRVNASTTGAGGRDRITHDSLPAVLPLPRLLQTRKERPRSGMSTDAGAVPLATGTNNDPEYYRVAERIMNRVADLEAPLQPDHPFVVCLLPPRPPPAPPAPSEVPRPKFRPKASLSPRSVEQLRHAYWEHVKHPVALTFGGAELSPVKVTAVVPGKAWVVPSMLDANECAAQIRLGEAAGLEPAIAASGAVGLRTSKRTNNHMSPETSAQLGQRLPDELLAQVEASPPHTCVRGLHPNWRIGRYDASDYFAAHMDQADSLTLQSAESDGESSSKKERLTSSHTVLIALSERAATEGGATRLFPTGKYDDTAVDVLLPRGYALVFEQTLLHSGLAVTQGTKYILQAGLLRGEPPAGRPVRNSTFKFAPALTNF